MSGESLSLKLKETALCSRLRSVIVSDLTKQDLEREKVVKMASEHRTEVEKLQSERERLFASEQSSTWKSLLKSQRAAPKNFKNGGGAARARARATVVLMSLLNSLRQAEGGVG